VHDINYVCQTEVHIVKPLLPEPSCFAGEIAIEKLKRYKSPDIDEIPAELIQAGGNTLCSEIYVFINSIWKKEEMLQQWKESVT
jgi:hypothetical protein